LDLDTINDKIIARINEIMAMKKGRPVINSPEYDGTIEGGFSLPVAPLEMGSRRPVDPGSAGGLSLDLIRELRLLMVGMNKTVALEYKEWLIKVYNL
jgi:hypothetical protein